MASKRKLPNGNWETCWGIYVEGKRQQRRRRFATAAAAERHRAQMELQEQRGIGSVRMTLAQYLVHWLKEKEGEVGLNTMAGYRRWVGHALRGAVAAMPIDRITPLHLEVLYKHLLSAPAGRGRPLSAVSVRHVASVLSNAFADAKRHKLVDDNPAEAAKRPRGQSRMAMPSAEQIAALLDDLDRNNPSLTDLAILLVTTGCRRSEALGLRWKDVDFAAGKITIKQVVIEHDGQWSIREGTKSIAGQRAIRVPTVAVEALRRQQAQVATARLKLGPHWRDHDLVFPNYATGGPRSPATITRAFTRAISRVATQPCGWPEDASPVHSLRHAAATMALAAGIDIGTLSARLGHSSPAVTARIYVHGMPDKDAEAGEVMAAVITSKSPLR